MPDYTRGTVLGAATMLPVTAATSMYLVNKANTMVVIALLALNVLSFAITSAMVMRYLINKKRSA